MICNVLKTMMRKDLSKLFAPKSIAIYGVSSDTTKIASTIFHNLLSSAYPGKIYPINPKYSELFGFECYPSAQKIPNRVELAIMVIPAKFSLEVLEDCHAKNIKHLIIISAGYKELGGEGISLEQQIKIKAQEYGITILGPNCLGLIVTESKMNASFAATNALSGDIAFLSQSGALCTAILDLANTTNLGFSHFVSLGNKVNLSENELIEYWLQSQKVKVIGGYLEEFTDGLDLCEIKKNIGIDKPIILLHPGKTKAAQNAMSSHTGSLAGTVEIIEAALKKAGIIQVSSITDIFNSMLAFSWLPEAIGHRVAIVTNAGGPGVLTTDAVAESNLEIALLTPETKSSLQAVLPLAASVRNPIDVLGDAMADRYKSVLEILITADEVDVIFLVLTPQLVTQIEDTAKLLVNFSKETSKPIIPIFLGGQYTQSGLKRLFDNKVIGFSDIDSAVKAVANVAKYTDYIKNRELLEFDLTKLKVEVSESNINLARFTTAEKTVLPESEVEELLKEFKFDLPKSAVINSYEQALEFADNNYPIVLKATTEEIVHKTNFKAVFTNIYSPEQLKSNLTSLQENIYNITKHEHPNVLIQEQIIANEEVLIGVKRDGGSDVYTKTGKGFGHLILFGKGGIYAEVYKDLASNLIPMSRYELEKLIDATNVAQIIRGTRAQPPLALKALINTINQLQKLIYNYPMISEIDINPAMLTTTRCIIVDAKIFLEK